MEYISKEGLEKIKKELNLLKTKKRLEISKLIEETKKLGDLSENAEYQEAREKQDLNERKIAELEEITRQAVIIEAQKTDHVVVGSTLEVETITGRQVFTIVGSAESHPQTGKISNESPLGRVFLNKRAGEEVEVKTPRGVVKYKILAIR